MTENLSPIPEFKDFGKIARFRTLRCRISEKIDGTNAQIYVPSDPSAPVLAASRNRWLLPGTSDNFDFRVFVAEHAELFRRLGPGRHFGEWWGRKIGRVYGLETRRLSMFNHDRFSGGLPEGLPPNVDMVPILYEGPVDSGAIQATIDRLYSEGSVACPGWTKPEGVIIEIAGMRWKVTDNGDKHKGEVDPATKAEAA